MPHVTARGHRADINPGSVYAWNFARSPPPLSTMIDLIDALAIGLSVLSVYALKKYLEVRGVWKRYR